MGQPLGTAQGREELRAILSDWPLERPRDWVRLVNEVMNERELEKLRACIARNRPVWRRAVARRCGQEAWPLPHAPQRRPAQGYKGRWKENN